MIRHFLSRTFLLLMVAGCFVGTAAAQEDSIYSFQGDAAVVSKYIWRGQRLTNDWSLQPAVTMGVGGFSFNAWGTIDLAAVNPGDSLPIGGMGADGLKGKFSEIDYTFSYEHAFESVTASGGAIFYTFPERSAALPSTTEVYGKVTLDSVPLTPFAALYVDVDQTNASSTGSNGLYVQFGASHSLPLNNDIFESLDISGTISFVNGGFTKYYYGGLDDAGPHDSSFTVALPIKISDNWSATGFVTYSALLGNSIRQSQYQDPRVATKPTGASYADTVWGGFSVSLSF
ncbi:MAG TPA: hypothetical protein VFY29_14655 [Terriglobia bacterium]|nr:hypothetical protein [Terriglobia bacterium]